MEEKLRELLEELTVRENRAYCRMERKRQNDNPIEASKQEGKFIAYRYAREMVEELLNNLGGDDEEEDFDDWVDETGYDPYSGCYCDDL